MARKGQWRDVPSQDTQALYDAVTSERLGPVLKAWLEGGRGTTPSLP
jgi:hypothetical protein